MSKTPVVVDLTGVRAGGPLPLEPGIYPATISKSEIKPSKNSGEDTLYLDLAVQAEDEEGEEVERNMRWNTSMQKKQLGRFKKLLIDLGYDADELEQELNFDEADLVGIACRVRVTQERHYQDADRMTNRITAILGPEETEGEAWGGESE